MVSLLNDARLAAGKPTLGFLNYFLYQNEAAFLDIIHGDNHGFSATKGYDPASGLGTFSPTTFSQLKAAAMSSTPPPPSPAGPVPTLLMGLRHSESVRSALDSTFWAVADPAQPATQLSGPADIRSITQADQQTVAAAKEWLRALGCDMSTLQTHPTGDAIEVSWPAGSGLRNAPKAPSDIADYLILKGGTGFPALKTQFKPIRAAGPKGLNSSDSGLGPEGQKAVYGVPPGLKGTNSKNVQMVFGTGTFGYRESDISMFFDQYAQGSSTKDISFDKDNKWKDKTGKNFVEGELDVSYIAGMAPGVKTLVANTNTSASTESGEGFGAALLTFLVDLNARDEVPMVLSMSLGSLSFGACDKVCHALSKKGHTYDACWKYMQTQFQVCMFDSEVVEQRIDAELAKLGLRGVTVTAASGDGASHFAFGPFSGDIGDSLNEIICTQMNMPVYPTCSPYLLSVGGIQWQSDDMYGPECSKTKPCAWTDGGAGFSWQHAQPAYQSATSPAYVKLGEKVAPKTMPKASTYNATGRGYPDVAALAQFGIPLCDYGGCSGSGGTSASAPTVAGMLSLVNDARLNKGLKPLGFVNTKLYKLMEDASTYAECFTDVGIEKVGDDWDCNTYSSCDGCNDGGGSGQGFVATKGWDAQTGFGQPKFAGWLKHLGTD